MKIGDKVQVRKKQKYTGLEITGAAGEYVNVKNYLGQTFTFHESDLEPYGDSPSEDSPSKVKAHAEICKSLNETYRRKNHDYGDSFTHTRAIIPNAILVRLNDKISRLNTLLLNDKQKVKDESIDDTLIDLANYCIMELVERKMENE